MVQSKANTNYIFSLFMNGILNIHKKTSYNINVLYNSKKHLALITKK